LALGFVWGFLDAALEGYRQYFLGKGAKVYQVFRDPHPYTKGPSHRVEGGDNDEPLRCSIGGKQFRETSNSNFFRTSQNKVRLPRRPLSTKPSSFLLFAQDRFKGTTSLGSIDSGEKLWLIWNLSGRGRGEGDPML